MIAHETGVASTADPLGGSYFVEELTDKLERQAYDYFDQIRELGGVIPAIRENFFQQEIADAAFVFQSEIEGGERTVDGVNAFEETDDEQLDLLKITISPESVSTAPDDIELLEDMILAAVAQGMEKAKELKNSEIGKVTGGFADNLSDLFS